MTSQPIKKESSKRQVIRQTQRLSIPKKVVERLRLVYQEMGDVYNDSDLVTFHVFSTTTNDGRVSLPASYLDPSLSAPTSVAVPVIRRPVPAVVVNPSTAATESNLIQEPQLVLEDEPDGWDIGEDAVD